MGAALPALSIALALLLQSAAAISDIQNAAGNSGPQRFRSSIDVVQVDVSAIDNSGRPVTGLTADDFELRVDGRPRRITSVQFVNVASSPPPVADAAPRFFSSNADAAGGRLIMVVVDRSSIASGRGKAAIEAASRFVSQLNRADRVALASIPQGPQVTFTADHALVQRRIQEIDGTALASLGPRNLGIADAMAFERRSDAAMAAVYERECGSIGSDGGRGGGQSDVLLCRNEVRSEAIAIAQDARERARTTIQSLRTLIDSLPPSQTPKILVLISEGLVVDRETTQLAWLDAKAAAAHVTVFSLHLESSQVDASQRRPQAQPTADRTLQEQGLDRLASATRGDVFRVMSNSDFAFQRLALELSGYYLLGFEPDSSDRGVRPHQITVTVRRGGVTVRSRRQFSMDAAARPAADPVQQIVATLRDPLPAAEIPITLAAYSFRDPNHEKLRLLIAAEIDRSINPYGEFSAGFVVVGFDGKLIASQMDASLRGRPSHDGLNQRYFSTVLADPGKYTVKFVVVDDAGRRGSVEYLTDARLVPAGPIRVTDLLIVDGAVSDASAMAPIVSGGIRGTTLHGYLELFAESDVLKDASVTLEIAKTESSPALERVPVQLETTKESVRCRVAAARVNLAAFPPGNYVARAVIALGLDAVGQVTRPFTIERTARF